MPAEIIFSVEKAPEVGYEARAVGHPILRQAATMDELKQKVREAVRCYFGEGKPLPAIRFVKVLPAHLRFGSAKGEFTVPENFNEPDPEIEDMFYK